MRRRAVLGYPSQTAAVQDMLTKGRSRDQIALALNRGKGEVGGIIHGAGRASMVEAVNVPREILDKLKPYADAREINRHELARRLLQVIAAEGMADAILDDGKANE